MECRTKVEEEQNFSQKRKTSDSKFEAGSEKTKSDCDHSEIKDDMTK